MANRTLFNFKQRRNSIRFALATIPCHGTWIEGWSNHIKRPVRSLLHPKWRGLWIYHLCTEYRKAGHIWQSFKERKHNWLFLTTFWICEKRNQRRLLSFWLGWLGLSWCCWPREHYKGVDHLGKRRIWIHFLICWFRGTNRTSM